MRKFCYICLFIMLTSAVAAQDGYRGSIPEALLMPAKGEEPRYPIDTVIGEMGQGEASDAAFSFANWVAAGLLTGRMNHPALEFVNPVIREGYLSALGRIEPRFYRIGGGREEPDGSTSFLVRFVGREYGIVAEMYVRHGIVQEAAELAEPAQLAQLAELAELAEVNVEPEEELSEALDETHLEEAVAEMSEEPAYIAVQAAPRAAWMLEDLILEEAMSREQEEKTSLHRLDSAPYERFF